MNKYTKVIFYVGVLFFLVGAIRFGLHESVKSTAEQIPQEAALVGYKTNTFKRIIDLSELVVSGTGKNKTRSLTNPEFIAAKESPYPETTKGVVINIDNQTRFYPNPMLLWHEIVNDQIGETKFAVTYCRLCATSVVFDRIVDSKELLFNVSGYIYESNLVMYDSDTESLWSQVRAQALVGNYANTQLQILPMQTLTLGKAFTKYPEITVLSTNTGYDFDYTFDPFNLDPIEAEKLFSLGVDNSFFKPQEIMYVIPFRDTTLAINQMKLREVEEIATEIAGDKLLIAKSGEEVIVTINGAEKKGYYEMWFSWAMRNQDAGLVWELQ